MVQKTLPTSIGPFLLWTFLLSWALWLTAIGSGATISSPGAFFPYLLGGFGPSAAALLFIAREPQLEVRRSFLNRIATVHGVPGAVWTVLVLLPPLAMAAGIGWDLLLGGFPPAFELISAIERQPLILASVISLSLIFGPVSEELGWRGFAQPKLEQRFGVVLGNLILGGVWSLWHLPLFFLPGTVQSTWSIGDARFFLYLFEFIPLAYIYAWIFRRSDHSILAAILLHFNLNLIFTVTGTLSMRAELFRILFLCLSGLLLVLYAGDVLQKEAHSEETNLDVS